MAKNGVKERLVIVVGIAKKALHWGFMPMVLYLGFKRGPFPGMPPLNLLSLVW